MIKDTIKRTKLYNRYYVIRREYIKNGKVPFSYFFRCKLINGLSEKSVTNVLKRVNYKNESSLFNYYIDDSFILPDRYRVIGNIPMDYSYLIKTPFLDIIKSNERLGKAIIFFCKKNKLNIPMNSASSLKEALQLILFWNQLLWQTGHKLIGLGRLDKVLESFKVDDSSRDLLLVFLTELHKFYQFKSSQLKGDTGQIILLGGNEEDGSFFCNEYTYLLIDCVKELALPDPKLLLRVGKNIPSDLLRAAVDCISTGVGSPLLSNDDMVVPCLLDYGYDKMDAFNYGVSACWEPLSIGNSLEQNNIGCINFGKSLNRAILDEEFIKATDISTLKKLLFKHIKCDICEVLQEIDNIVWEKDPLLSMLLGVRADVSEGGLKYNNYGILSVGMSSLVDSILNINDFVFEEKKYSLSDIQSIVLNDYIGYKEEIHLFSENRKFGRDKEDAIFLTNEVIRFAEECVVDYRNRFGGKVKFGLSSPSYLSIGIKTPATLDGRKAWTPFSTHISNDNISSPTELINFVSNLKFSGLSSNANVLDIMVNPSIVNDNRDKFVQLIKGAIDTGFFQMQFNVLSYAQLVDAKANPEKYPKLIVRVWGFSTYFIDLPDEYKDLLIKRAKEMERIA